MRSVIIRDFELSVSTLLGVGFTVIGIIVGSVWALQTKPPQLANCSRGPTLKLSPINSKNAVKAGPEAASLDATTRDLTKNNRTLGKKAKPETDDKVVSDLKARKNLMLDQMRHNPDGAIKQVLAQPDRAKAQSLTNNCVESPTVTEGSLEIVHADFTNGSSVDNYTLTTNHKEHLLIHPANKPRIRLTSGQHIKIKGYRLDNDVLFDASSQAGLSQVKKPTSLLETPVAAAATSDTIGSQQTIVLMVYFQNTTQPSLTQASVNNTIFTQMNSYYQETSYNQMSVVGTSVNWQQIPLNQTCDIASGLDAVKNAAIASANPTVNFANYSRIVIVGNYNGASCGWGGVGTIGKTYVSTANGVVNASVNWIDSSSMSVETHEFGHNLGLDHAEFYNCGSVTFNTTGCTTDEYGDQYSPMGNGYTRHMNAPEKEFLGWLSPAQVQTVTANGSYSIEPLETATAGSKTLKIQRSNGGSFGYDYTYYEYRTATGSDNGLNANVLSGALFHNFTDSYTLLLDASPPGDPTTPALPVGGSYTDPATATKVTLASKTPTALTFNVVLGKTDFSTPTVNITAPAFDATVSGSVTAAATANAASGIQKIEFYVDNAASPAFTATTAPYNYAIDTTTLSNGYHYMYALAYDKSGEAYGVPGNASVYAYNRFAVNNSTSPVYRFYSPVRNTHFFTASQAEKDYLAGDNSWNYEGIGFIVPDCSVASSVYRFYSPVRNTHFFTASQAEKDYLAGDRTWNYEGIGFCADTTQKTNEKPVYRFYSPVRNTHFFTANPAEKDYLAGDKTWNYEGIGWYAF